MKPLPATGLLALLGLLLCLPFATAEDPPDSKALLARLKAKQTPARFPPKLLGYRLHSTLGHPVTGNVCFIAQGLPPGTQRYVRFKSEIVEFATDLPEILYYAYKDQDSGQETGVLIYAREEEPSPKPAK